MAGALLILALVDFGWGVGSFSLRHSTLGGASLLPPDKSEPQRFQWHALLQAVPIPSLRFTSATGLAISHTSEGTRGRNPVPDELAERSVVSTFGGSTTYDIGAGEGDTWSDRLAAALDQGEDKGRFFVVNHGVPGYTTVEHLIQTAFYQVKFGKKPRCAIYYVGWNDLRNAHIPNLDPAYADFDLPSQVDSLKVRRVGGSNITISPVLTMLARFAAPISTPRYFVDPYGRTGSGSDPALEAMYERNIWSFGDQPRAASPRSGRTAARRERLQSDERYGWLLWCVTRLLAVAERFNAIPERGEGPGDVMSPFCLTRPIFVDQATSRLRSRRFAEDLAPAVRGACR